MQLYLEWSDFQGQRERLSLASDEILIGRKSDADIRLSNPYVSRHHAKLVRDGDRYILKDLGSTHGTFVNGRRIESHPVRCGDQILIGKVAFQLVTDGDQERENVVTADDDYLEKALHSLTSVFASTDVYAELQKISCLLELETGFGTHFPVEASFRQILKFALQISGAERGFILVSKNRSFEYAVGLDGKGSLLPSSEFITSQSIVNRVATQGKPIFMVEGIEGEFAQQQSIQAMGLRAVACLPIQGISANSQEMQILGILYLDSKSPMHALTGLDQKILTRLANEAGTAFERVEMLRTLEERRLFEQELALARETQQALLPPSLPSSERLRFHAHSQPTRYVGGDFYDFLALPENRLAAVLADVSGKGISAALLSSLIQGALEMECRRGEPSAQALTRLNQIVYERSPSNRFATAFFVLLHPDGQGEYISAGHNPAYLFRSADGSVETLDSSGLVLGVFARVTYSSVPVQLRAGDILAVYSDGLTEAIGPGGDMFGEEKLVEIIGRCGASGAAVLKDTILRELESFTQRMAQNDDITFLLIEAV